MGKKLAENPIIILIGLTASVIAIYSFVTGDQSIGDPVVENTPTSSLSASLAIEKIAFCESHKFDSIREVCTVSQDMIPQGTTVIYVSWVYKGDYSGEYTRRWYSNDMYLDHLTRPDRKWGKDGETSYTYVEYQAGLVAGEYKLEFRLNADNGVVGSAGFTVR